MWMFNVRSSKLPHICSVYWKKKKNATLLTMHSPGLAFRSYLNVDSLDDTGDYMEHLHFCVALCYLLQQLEEEPKYGLQVLQWENWSLEIRRIMLVFSDVSACQFRIIYSSFGINENVLTGRNCSVRNSKSSTGEDELSQKCERKISFMHKLSVAKFVRLHKVKLHNIKSLWPNSH